MKRKYQLPKAIFKVQVEILTCTFCGCGITWPQPTLSDSYYEQNENYDDVFVNNAKMYKKFAIDLLDSLNKNNNCSGMKLLDVACGGGFLVEEAEKRGYQALGIDANSNMRDWAVERGLNVIQGDVSSLGHETGNYNVIVLSHILEHVLDPESILIQCKALLSDNGIILISQTNYKGFLPNWFPWGWYGWQPKEHYWHFTPRSLSKLAKNLGFTVINVDNESLYHPFVFSSDLGVLFGKNFISLLGFFGKKIKKGDSFNMQLSSGEK